jgi:hypothetical protein
MRLHARALDLVRANRPVFEAVADALVAGLYLPGPAFRKVVAKWAWRSAEPRTRTGHASGGRRRG